MKIIYWKSDPAACNIVEYLEKLGIKDTIASETSLLKTETVSEENADFFVVPSTHRSDSGKSTLTVHPTGNFGKAEMGGREHELSYTNPAALKIGLKKIAEAKLPGYEVAMECTHHGPTTWEKPLVFIEIGSSEKQWKDKKAGEVIANAISAIKDSKEEFENFIGFGGTHYCSSFSKIQLESKEIAIGHVAPKYASEFLDKKIIEEMLKKSNAEKALIDWNGVKSDARSVVLKVLGELGVEWKKTSEV